MIGAAAAGQIKWFESFSIPGLLRLRGERQRTLKDFGSGLNTPLVAVVTTKGDVTKAPGVKDALQAAIDANPGARSSSDSDRRRALLVLLDGKQHLRLDGQAHDVRGDLPPRDSRRSAPRPVRRRRAPH